MRTWGWAAVPLAVLVGGLVAIAVAPAQALAVLTILVPFVILAATASTIYLALVFNQQRRPRSVFFRMVVESFVTLCLVGAWIGYLSVARLLERSGIGILPAPSPTHSAPISALIVIVVFWRPIRFALEVYRRRRRTVGDQVSEKEE